MSESEYYKRYMQLPTHGYASDRTVVEDFYIETVQNNDMLESVVEEQSILWCDDIDFALIMVVRTLENCREKQDDLPIRREYKSEDDLSFTKELFRTTVFSAAAIAGRKVRILHQLTQPADHPVSIYHPEGEYLKGLVLYVE